MISLLVAHDLNRVIGFENQMPWHIPEELKYFKEVTMGKAVIMGRKTFESIGKPLPGRLNIILTHDASYSAEGIETFTDIDEAIKRAEEYSDEVVIIGGSEIFKQTMDIADRMYVTVIRHEYEGDVFFPVYGKEWTVTSESDDHFTEEGIAFSYFIYEKES